MSNCYFCGNFLGIYSKGTVVDKEERYILCPRCYRGISGYLRPLKKMTQLEQLDELESKFNKKVETGKLKDREIEVIKAAYADKRRELVISTQMIKAYEKEQGKSKTELSVPNVSDEKKHSAASGFVTTADLFQGKEIESYMGPVSSQKLVKTEVVEQEEELNQMKQQLSERLYNETAAMGGNGVIGLKYTLTPVGADKMILMADGTGVKLK
ncbi:MAG: heavy metal-binding domain-containing protein [Lachnospiraceae bacterium]|nr:heavy metal-binding domain-containing protein [Lachnospiraceae bacterium]